MTIQSFLTLRVDHLRERMMPRFFGWLMLYNRSLALRKLERSDLPSLREVWRQWWLCRGTSSSSGTAVLGTVCLRGMKVTWNFERYPAGVHGRSCWSEADSQLGEVRRNDDTITVAQP